LWTCRPPRAFVHATSRTPRRAADRAPPRPRQLARAEENFARHWTSDLAALPKRTSHVAVLQTSPRFAPSHTPTCTEGNFATRPPLDHSDARGGEPCRDAGLQTSRPRCPLSHANARGGTPRRDAGLQTSRPRRHSTQKMPRKPSLGLPHQQRVLNVHRAYEETVRVGLKECAQDQTCAFWCSRLPTLRLNDRRWGLALVVQRSGKAGAFTVTVLKPMPKVSKKSPCCLRDPCENHTCKQFRVANWRGSAEPCGVDS